MNESEGKSSVKNVLFYIAMALSLPIIAACGGGGGSQAPTVKTTATLTINLAGTLPAEGAIAGAAFIVTLPANVTPAMTNGAVGSGVVALSGTFTGGTLTTPISTYTAATVNALGTLSVTLANSAPAGVTQVGEVAKITLQLANGATPSAANFGVSTVSSGVIDVDYRTIDGMSVSVANVTLQ